MRRVISLLDLDSFLQPRVFRLPLALPIKIHRAPPPARNIPARAAGILNLGVYSFIGTIRPSRSAQGSLAIPPWRTYVDSHERKRQFVSATPPPLPVPLRRSSRQTTENWRKKTRGRITDGPDGSSDEVVIAVMSSGQDYSCRCTCTDEALEFQRKPIGCRVHRNR